MLNILKTSYCFLLCIVVYDYYSWFEMIYDIALAIVLYIFYEKFIKTLVAFEFKVFEIINIRLVIITMKIPNFLK